MLDLLPQARLSGPMRGLDGDLDSPGVTLSRESLDGDRVPQPPWFDGLWRQSLGEGPAVPPRSRATPSRIDDVEFLTLAPADGGLHRLFAALPSAALVVRARVRAAAGKTQAKLWIVSHARSAPSASELRAELKWFDEVGLGHAFAREVPIGGSSEWRDVEVVLPPVPQRRSISISLMPGEHPLDVDAIEVRTVLFARAVVSRARLAGDESTAPARRLIEVAQSSVDTLLLPAGAEVNFPLSLPAEPSHLIAMFGAVGAAEGGRAAIEVRVDGESVGRFERDAASMGAAQPLPLESIDLARFAGRSIELSFLSSAIEGDEAQLLTFLGSPRIVAAPRVTPPVTPESGATDIASSEARHVIVVSLDTLRADALGCYGRAGACTPVLDELAARGARFETVWSPSSYTLPTHASMFSSQHPLIHRLLSSDDRIDPRRTAMLARRLRDAGFATAAFTGGGFVAPEFGFASGFDLYSVDDPMGRTRIKRGAAPKGTSMRAASTPPLEPALEWIRAHATVPSFLFLHTFFVHNYAPSAEFLRPFSDPAARWLDDDPVALREALLKGDSIAAARLRALYAGTVAQVDHELIGRLQALLEQLGIADETLLCVVADHGEEFGEHGNVGHGHELWSESTRVPWILAGPGIAPCSIDAPVELTDVAVTLAARLALPPEARAFGRDALFPGDTARPPPVQILGRPDRATRRESLVAGPWQLLRWHREGRDVETRLFHLVDDPAAASDRAMDESELRGRLEARLDQQLIAMQALLSQLPTCDTPEGRGLSEEQRQLLRELGYLDE
ncbi:MAG: hypothetical protein EXS13_01810 [Planctomycetes bacterium]|nr:hypothetical protein [Planctomycetota bacterium]